MPNREDILRDQTYKGDVDELDKRIYYTLTLKSGTGREGELPVESRIHRTAKLLSLVVTKLHEQGVLDDDEIDDMLFDLLG
jgi:hypothetical protein